jgi:hypothetical protein
MIVTIPATLSVNMVIVNKYVSHAEIWALKDSPAESNFCGQVFVGKLRISGTTGR